MKNIAIYGAGGFGREIAAVINSINHKKKTWNLIGFFDDIKETNSYNEYGRILGNINTLNSWPDNLDLIIAVADSNARQKLVNKISNHNISYPNLIYRTGFADTSNYNIGKGNIILEGCYISCNVSIGDFNIMNGSDIFGHDGVIGSFNSFMGGIWISGNINICNCNYFGVGSIIIQSIKIGNGVTLGAGAVLMTNPKDNSTYLGNPAKIFKY